MKSHRRYILPHERAELEREGRQYFLTVLLVLAVLITLSVAGHAWISKTYAQGMPELRVEMHMPQVSK